MTSIEERYRPPASNEPVADTSRLSKDEWRYAAKVFVIATLVLSILKGLLLTLQTIYALRAFGAEARVAGIVAVSALRHVGLMTVQFAVCIAIILVVHRRQKRDIPPPTSGLFIPMFLIVPVVTPIAGLIMCTVSVLFLMFGYDQAFAIAWESIRSTFVFADAIIGMLLAAAGSIVFAGLSAELARLLARVRGWPILKCFIASFLTGVVNALVGSVIWRIIYAVEFGEGP